MTELNKFNQRWRNGRASYRPAGEPIKTSQYEVVELDGDRSAKRFVHEHHYSGTYPSARFRYGLVRDYKLVGVAVFSHPTNNKTLTNLFPFEVLEGVELGRFVLLDDVPANGETWFLARCFELIRRRGILGIVSFSDDQARTTETGETVFPGHIGTIYQAHNAVYCGRGVGRGVRLLPDGLVFAARAIQKIRAGEVGWQYASRKLESYIPEAKRQTGPNLQDRIAWLEFWLPRLTRPMKHPGCHKYAWVLDKKLRKFLPSPQSYPKRVTDFSRGEV